MRTLILLAAVLLLVIGEKHNMLKENKTPKDSWKKLSKSPVCDECKVIITRFSQAIEDPEKINELKAILRMLCHETSYVEECKLFVNRLDYFIQHIKQYLKDPEEACKHLRMCANEKIEKYHRVCVAYMNRFKDGNLVRNSLLCEECEFAAAELKNVIEQEKSQQRIKKFLSEEICSRLGRYQGSCDVMLDQFLPTLFEELDKMFTNSQQFCADIGLCQTSSDDEESVQVLPRDEVSVFANFRF